MAADFVSRVVYVNTAGASVSVPLVYPIRAEIYQDGDISARIASVESPGIEGDADEPGEPEAKSVVVTGTIIGESSDETRAALDLLLDTFRIGRTIKLYKHSDRYLVGQPRAIEIGQDDGLDHRPWAITLRCASPLFLDAATQTQALAAGANTISAGGTFPALPIVTVVVTTPGTFTIVGPFGRTLVFAPTAPGTYTIDCGAGTAVTSLGASVIDKISGEFLRLSTDAGTYTLTLSGGAVGTVSISWQRRWL